MAPGTWVWLQIQKQYDRSNERQQGQVSSSWKVFTSGEIITVSSSKGPLTSGRAGRADSICKEGPAVFKGLKSPDSLDLHTYPQSNFSRLHFFLISALTLTQETIQVQGFNLHCDSPTCRIRFRVSFQNFQPYVTREDKGFF